MLTLQSFVPRYSLSSIETAENSSKNSHIKHTINSPENQTNTKNLNKKRNNNASTETSELFQQGKKLLTLRQFKGLAHYEQEKTILSPAFKHISDTIKKTILIYFFKTNLGIHPIPSINTIRSEYRSILGENTVSGIIAKKIDKKYLKNK